MWHGCWGVWKSLLEQLTFVQNPKGFSSVNQRRKDTKGIIPGRCKKVNKEGQQTVNIGQEVVGGEVIELELFKLEAIEGF